MQIKLRKQPTKYLEKSTTSTFNKLTGGLNGLKKWEGDIAKLRGRKDEYRLKLPPFRIIFTYVKGDNEITVTKIDSCGGAYKK